MLNLDVQAFETRYDRGRGKAPLIAVQVHAVLLGRENGQAVGEKTFAATARADANRVSAIVDAYDQALGALFSDLIGWSGGFAPHAAPAASTD
jgi:ABC-type uncharacterized transport system auxiliary subunit